MKKSIDRFPNGEAIALELEEKTVGIAGCVAVVVPFVFAAKVPKVAVFITKIKAWYKVLRRWLLLSRPAAGQQEGDSEGKYVAHGYESLRSASAAHAAKNRPSRAMKVGSIRTTV